MKYPSYIFLIFLICHIYPQDLPIIRPAPEIQAVRTEKAIEIDGFLTEPPWQTQGYSNFLQSDPHDGSPATQQTVVWIAYDRENLYIAARMYDEEPDKIIDLLGRRDEEVESDWFIFGVDPYFDKRSGYLFAVNPAGSIMDGTLFNDEGQDLTWDGIWDCAARIDDSGWSVEIRIPFLQLRFKKKNTYIWGVNFFRVTKRTNEETVFAWTPKEKSGYVSRFARLIGISNIEPGRLMEFSPFIVGKTEFSPKEPGNPFKTGSTLEGNIGFDFKSGLKSNLTLDMTANPDFGQVEVDPAVINISDQETYYAEKRPFFIEGADIFRFGSGGVNIIQNLGWNQPSFFYSRRIGRAPQGVVPSGSYSDQPEWSTILAAAKITGKIGSGWNLGVLSALTQREYAQVENQNIPDKVEVEPSTHYSVIRAQKEFNNGRSGLGFLTTSVLRDLHPGWLRDNIPDKAFSFAVDGWTSLDKDRVWVISGWAGGTSVRGTKSSITTLQLSPLHYYQRPDVDYVNLDPDATSLNGWAGRLFLNKQQGNLVFNASLGAISPGFHAVDLGYHTRGDIINGHLEAGYQSFHPDNLFQNWKLTLATHRSYDFSGNRTDENYHFTAFGQFRNYWTSKLYLSYDPPRYSHWLTRGGPLALYPWGFIRQINITSDNRKSWIYSFSAHYRTHPYGSYNWSIGFNLRWKPSPNFNLSVAPSYTWRHSVGQWIKSVQDELKVETYGTRYVISDVIQKTFPIEIRINWTFTPKLSLQAYFQPFIGVGDFFKYKELLATRTFDFNIYGENGSTIYLENGFYHVDPDGTGPAKSFFFRDPDFNLKSLRGTVVFRWEYKPGSIFYAVWTQDRADYSHPGDFNLSRDFQALFNASGDNIFLIKISHRFKL